MHVIAVTFHYALHENHAYATVVLKEDAFFIITVFFIIVDMQTENATRKEHSSLV